MLALPHLATGQTRREALSAAEREHIQQQLDAQARAAPQTTADPGALWLPPVASESPCFLVHRLELLGNPALGGPGSFAWLLADLGDYSGACLGPRSLDALRRNLDARLLARGYVTSHVSLPPQNLSQGVLLVQLHLGRLARLDHRTPAAAAAGQSSRPPSCNALATRAGGVLNLRDVEQTLENLSRLPSQALQFQIEADEQPGMSVLATTPVAAAGGAQARRWRLSAGVDNAAARDYGQWQSNLQATLDAPLGLADQLSAAVNRSLRNAGGERLQTSALLSYFIPWGYHAVLLNASRSSHARPIQGLSTRFSENGFDSSMHARWQWAAWRTASSRWLLWGGTTQRSARNYVDDVELILQRRRVNSWDWGLNSWTRWPAGELSLDYEQAVSTRVAIKTDFQVDAPALARTRRLQLVWVQPVALTGRLTGATGERSAGQYEARLAWAVVRRPASGADLQNLGSRWSVRGFDAQGFLSGQEQLTFKQDLRWPAWTTAPGLQLQPYAALDYGRVAAQAAAAPRAGHALAGLALGLRLQGQAWWGLSGWTGDVALATPLHKPAGFAPTATVIYSSFNVHY